MFVHPSEIYFYFVPGTSTLMVECACTTEDHEPLGRIGRIGTRRRPIRKFVVGRRVPTPRGGRVRPVWGGVDRNARSNPSNVTGKAMTIPRRTVSEAMPRTKRAGRRPSVGRASRDSARSRSSPARAGTPTCLLAVPRAALTPQVRTARDATAVPAGVRTRSADLHRDLTRVEGDGERMKETADSPRGRVAPRVRDRSDDDDRAFHSGRLVRGTVVRVRTRLLERVFERGAFLVL